MSQFTLSGKPASNMHRPYCPEASPASRSPVPGSAEARRMTVTSGRKCLEWCRNSGPLGSLERMLLASSVWHSMTCLLTWSVRVTPAGRSFFRLRGSVPRTCEIGYSLWPTMTRADAQGHAYQYSRGDPSKPVPTLVGAARMYPTPHANCHTGAGEHGTGGLNLQTAVLQMVPTPCAQDAKNSTLPPSQLHRDTVPGALIRGMFYTPTSVSGNQNGRIDEWGGSHNPYRGEKGKCHPQYLNPEFVEWLMGFPIGWTGCDVSETR